MIKEKKDNIPQAEVSQEIPAVNTPEQEEQNPLAEMYYAVKRAVSVIRENPNDSASAPFFKTVAIDTGQFARLIRSDNTESEVALPAVFIHYTNVRYLVQQQRIGQGRAIMRVRFILNTLNNQDPERECDPFHVFQWVNQAIQDAKNHEPSLTERCQLLYFDMPTTTNMLQAYWVDYEVWFRETSAWKYRDWIELYLVMPPFTNHGDAPQRDSEGHGNHPRPHDRDAITVEPSVELPDKERE